MALAGMTGGRGQGSRWANSYNSISSGVKTRAAKASGVGPVSGAKCGMCMKIQKYTAGINGMMGV